MSAIRLMPYALHVVGSVRGVFVAASGRYGVPTERKERLVAELEDLISRSTIAISANYRGMSVSDMTNLRRRMRETGVEFRVVKNTLLKMAAERGGKPALFQIVDGPTALVFGFDEPRAPASAIAEFVRTSRTSLTLTGAYFEGQPLPASGVADLASLPSRGQLLSQLMGDLQSPLATLAGLLSGTLREFASLIDARSNQMEESTT
jgi:large subunit ribosomal protein L10